MNIYVIGGMGSGKTTVADYLVHYLPNAKRLTLAEPIKQIVANLDTMSDAELLDNFIKPYYNKRGGIENSVYEAIWGQIFFETRFIKKDGKKNRKRLQFVGTDGARVRIDDKMWIKIALEKAKQSPEITWIVDDCRFQNEAKAFKDDGWVPIYLHIEPEKQVERLKKLYGDSFNVDALTHPSELDIKEIQVPIKSIFVSYEDKQITLENIKRYIWQELHLS